MVKGRALHYVFKIGDRALTAKFYRDILGMKVLRHEEFADGCEATCNGPYANRWSKTMVGYGPEDTHFAVELTYNYGIFEYAKGNDFLGITIRSKESLQRAVDNDWPVEDGNVLTAPGGYKFHIIDEPQPKDTDPVVKVSLACMSLERSIAYWRDLLGLQIFTQTAGRCELGFAAGDTKLELVDIGVKVERALAYGRIAFACPHADQPALEDAIKKAGQEILTPLVSLDTPGKATVRVIILADPDKHEICFVDDEAFRQLSQVDPDGDKLLNRYIGKDKSAATSSTASAK